jgi:2-oxoglutarate dehydrogenase E1 component
MTVLPIISAFNDGYVAEMQERFARDPYSVDESWRQFFAMARQVGGGQGAATPADPAYLRKIAGAAALVQAIRQYGHLGVQLDPLGSPPSGAAELKPEFHGITDADLEAIPAGALGFDDDATAADAVARLRADYSATLGFEFEHIEEEEEREWFRRVIEHGEMRRTLTDEEKRAVLRRLTEVDGLERFLGRAYQGYKRFSIEGNDTLVPMLEAAIEGAAAAGAHEVVMAMAHRGRINVLTHVLDKPVDTVFEEFEGKYAANAASDTGDVKYHLGAETDRERAGGKRVHVSLMPNPSHLEMVNPVLEGVARAQQRVPNARGVRDESSVLPIAVHGDAAFPGEGVVAETFNLSNLRGYRTGGTLHIIVNNQIGFTTDPREGRSTHYASDLAKGFEVPIVHVNGDDAEACIASVWLGLAYRERFGKDFLIDLVGYRRQGHNEADEPVYTQPMLYAAIKAHPTTRELWGKRLTEEGVIEPGATERLDAEVQSQFEQVHARVKAGQVPVSEPPDEGASQAATPVATAVAAEQLIALNERMLSWPSDFHPLPKLARVLERRRPALTTDGGIDWGHAEALAWASLLVEGTPVRISGQDVERGTFSHRQSVLHDHETGESYTPLQHLGDGSAQFEIYNSPLSEVAVLAFEYGYSVAARDSLVLWEAQFGDFANVAQPIIDQFISSDGAKWGQDSGVVLLLPHGYEGQGPEHSSARLERFLQMCAENNMRVAYPSTPAQYFHILRRQARSAQRRPLVLMQPKSLLRLPLSASHLADLANGSFQPIIDDAAASSNPAAVRRLVLCTGKMYYDLIAAMHAGTGAVEQAAQIAIVRVDELYPWPHEALAAVLDRYTDIEEVVWTQEEPRNMGAWSFVSPRLRGAVGNAMTIRYIGRPERASPAEGYAAPHAEQQARLVAETLAPLGGKRGVASRATSGAR